MPELPEVEITMRKLAPQIKGRKIISFVSDWPRGLRAEYKIPYLQKDIFGRKIKQLSRIGKVLFLHLSPVGKRKISVKLAFHQRMSGRLAVLDRNEVEKATKHARIRIGLDNNKFLVFFDPRKFGVAWYGHDKVLNKDKYLNTLGPDALAVSWQEFNKRLEGGRGTHSMGSTGSPQASSGQAIKSFLLKQNIFAGIGNIVVDETLWFAKIHPQKKINHLSLKQRRALFLALKKVLKRSIAMGGSSMRDWLHPDQGRGEYQDNWRAYGRSGQKCYRCSRILKKSIVGGRGTTYCSFCQRV